MARCQELGIAAGAVQTPSDLLADPQLGERGHWQWVEHPEMAEPFLTEGWGFALSATQPRPRRHAPLLGEHTDYVLREVLGMAEEQVNAYIVDEVIR